MVALGLPVLISMAQRELVDSESSLELWLLLLALLHVLLRISLAAETPLEAAVNKSSELAADCKLESADSVA
jgi:hypothetical protein